MSSSIHKSGLSGVPPPQAYQKLGRYLLGAKIASGGMAVVYRAKFVGVEGFEKEFAVKKILPHWSHDEDFARMLIDEANVLVHLHHPNIVQVFELGLEAGTYFIVMEFIDGFDLRTVLRRLKERGRTMPLEILCHVAQHVCLGLEFSHGRPDAHGRPLNIVHRDVSPQNILLSRDGQVKLTDFGIAKMTGKTATTRSGVLKGKYAYMSPEQAQGSQIDARSDIFSLGALIYEMAAGKKCFEGETDLATLENVKRATVKWPTGFHPLLKQLISRALAADREVRYPNVSELKRDLVVFAGGLQNRSATEDLRKFLSELMGSEGPSHPRQTRDSPTRALPPEILPKTRSDADDGTVLAPETVLREPTVIEKDDPPPLLLPPVIALPSRPAGKIRAPRRRRASGFAASLLLTFLMIASFVRFARDPRDDDAPTPLNNASNVHAPASKPRHRSVEKSSPTTEARHEFPISVEIEKTQPVEQKLSLPSGPSPQSLSTSPHLEPPVATMQVTKAVEKTASKKIEYGTLTVDARPWGIVRIDGGKGRETPAKFTLSAGRHALWVRSPARDAGVKRTVEIPAGGTLKCRAGFAKTKMLACFR
jgi:serine/threonine-protein kinase